MPDLKSTSVAVSAATDERWRAEPSKVFSSLLTVKQFFVWMFILMSKFLSSARLHSSFFQLMFSPCDRTAVCVHYEEEHCKEPMMTSECSSFFDLQGAAQFHSRWGEARKANVCIWCCRVTKLQRCNVPHKNRKVGSWWNNLSTFSQKTLFSPWSVLRWRLRTTIVIGCGAAAPWSLSWDEFRRDWAITVKHVWERINTSGKL